MGVFNNLRAHPVAAELSQSFVSTRPAAGVRQRPFAALHNAVSLASGHLEIAVVNLVVSGGNKQLACDLLGGRTMTVDSYNCEYLHHNSHSRRALPLKVRTASQVCIRAANSMEVTELIQRSVTGCSTIKSIHQPMFEVA